MRSGGWAGVGPDRARVWMVVAGVAALVAAAAGCGDAGRRGGVDARTAGHVVEAAAERAGEAGSARVRLTMSYTEPGESGGMKAAGVVSWDPPLMDITMTGPLMQEKPVEIRILRVGDAVYQHAGDQGPQEPGGGRDWVKFDASVVVAGLPMFPLPLDLARAPDEQIARLRDANDLRRVGEERIDGVRTVHYRGTTGAGDERMVHDVWVDEQNYPRRLDTTFGADDSTQTVSAAFSDFGVAVHVTAPPAGDVVTDEELARQLDELSEEH